MLFSICLFSYLIVGSVVYGYLVKDYFSDGDVGPRDFYMTTIFWPIILAILFGKHIGRT